MRRGLIIPPACVALLMALAARPHPVSGGPGADRDDAAATAALPEAPTADDGGLVRPAMLTYGSDRMTGVCFASHFLELVRREATIRVNPAFDRIAMDSAALFDHPFSVMTGEGVFELTEAEVENLRRYLESGGFLLASAGCSSDSWNAAMARAIERVLPGSELKELTLDHEAFHTIFDLKGVVSRRRASVRIYAVELAGRLALVYSPQGLNDTGNAGGECCCCTGDEILSAKHINANLLAYALLR